jgi:hypothetical protein
MSTLKAVTIGAVAGVVVIAVVIAVAMMGLTSSAPSGTAANSVAVALVLPDEDGVVTLRVLDVYSAGGGKAATVRSVSPTTPAVVSGTGGTSLADAYSFGGGEMLADALKQQAGLPVSAWVVVDQRGWDALRGDAPLQIDLPSAIDVFDGKRLYSFNAGKVSISSNHTGRLLDGAVYLTPTQGRDVRVQVGDALRSTLASGGPDLVSYTRSSMPASALSEWARGVRSVSRVPGT